MAAKLDPRRAALDYEQKRTQKRSPRATARMALVNTPTANTTTRTALKGLAGTAKRPADAPPGWRAQATRDAAAAKRGRRDGQGRSAGASTGGRVR